jgi:senataxin
MLSQEELDELVSKLHDELEQIPPDAHWFCPKVGADDDEDYSTADAHPDGISAEEKARRLEDYAKRRHCTFGFSLILGFNEEKTKEWKAQYALRLSQQFETCHLCIRNWHKGRAAFLKQMTT